MGQPKSDGGVASGHGPFVEERLVEGRHIVVYLTLMLSWMQQDEGSVMKEEDEKGRKRC